MKRVVIELGRGAEIWLKKLGNALTLDQGSVIRKVEWIKKENTQAD